MNYKEEDYDGEHMIYQYPLEKIDISSEDDFETSKLFDIIRESYITNMLNPNYFNDFIICFSKQHPWNPSFLHNNDNLNISQIFFNILLDCTDEEIVKLTIKCIISLFKQKNVLYSTQLITFPIENLIKDFLEEHKYVEECFELLKQIISVDKYHLQHCLELIPIQKFSSEEIKKRI